MKKITPIRIILFLIFIFGVYKLLIYQYDEHVAKSIYTQMEQIDKQLDVLQTNALQLRAEKESNVDVIQKFNVLTQSNITQLKPGFIHLIENVDYDKNVEPNLLALVESTTTATYKLNHKLIKIEVKKLREHYNQRVMSFTQQIKDLTQEVQDINSKIASLDSESMRGLETARLKFLSEKISETVADLKGSLIDEIIDDILKQDGIDDKDVDGNE